MGPSKKYRPRTAGKRDRVLTLEFLEPRFVLATITVTTAQDTVDFNDGVTSLREAIFAANTVPGADTIKFDGSLGGQTIRLTQGELAITDDLSIIGLGSDKLTIDASGNDPTPNVKNGDGSGILDIESETIIPERLPSVSISGLTLTGGDSGGAGGAIYSAANLQVMACNIHDNAARGGGGIFAGDTYSYPATIDIEDSQFTNNSARTTWCYGGAIDVGLSQDDSNVTIRNCDVNNNSATASALFDPADVSGWVWGAGIALTGAGDMNILDNRIGHNVATGTWEWGGGLSATSTGNLNIVGNQFDENTATGTWAWGGGIYVDPRGNLNISNNQFDKNEALGTWSSGGGAAIEANEYGIEVDTQIMFAGNSITANSALEGGGVWLKLRDALASATLRDNDISNNQASGGAGIALDMSLSAGPLELVGNEIDHNTASRSGGGLYVEPYGDAAVEIRDSSFIGNKGGAIYATGQLSVEDSTLSENQSGGAGGAIFNLGSTYVNRSTISGNTAYYTGGGIYARVLTLENTIVAGNTNRSGPQDLAFLNTAGYGSPPPSPEDLGVNYQIRYSLIGTNAGVDTVLSEAPIGTPDENGNLIGGATHGVIDAQLSAPIYDGGRTMIQIPLASSPVINMGDPSAAPGIDGVPQFDERGTPFLRVAYGRIDIGAAEFQLRPPAIQGDYNRDSVVDGLDYILWRWNQGQQVTNFSAADGDGSGFVGPEDYTDWRAHFGETLVPPHSLPLAAVPKNALKTAAVSPIPKSASIGLVGSTQLASQLLHGGAGSAPAILPAEEKDPNSSLGSMQNDILAILATPQAFGQSRATQSIQPTADPVNDDDSVQSIDLAFNQLTELPLIPAITAVRSIARR